MNGLGSGKDKSLWRKVLVCLAKKDGFYPVGNGKPIVIFLKKNNI